MMIMGNIFLELYEHCIMNGRELKYSEINKLPIRRDQVPDRM